MASTRRRLGPLVCGRRSKWIVLGFWLVVMGVGFPLSAELTGAQDNDTASWLPGSAESTQVFEAQQDAFQTGEELPAIVVYERQGGITPEDQAKAAADAEAFAGVEHVTGDVVGPIPSEDGEALQVIVRVDPGDGGWFALGDAVDAMNDILADEPEGLSAYVAGPAGVSADFADAFEGIDGTLLYAAMGVVIVILLISYRSPVLWFIPVFSAFTALTAAQAVVYLLAEYAGVTVNGQTAGILLVLVFGASTDYALLLIARYREELRRHEDRHEAMAFALHRAGPAIVASAATVTVGMLCLLAAEMNSTRGMGPVLAVGIVIGLAAMLTLLPALLVISGRWVFWPLKPRFGSDEPTERGFWARTGRAIAHRPRTVWIGTSLALGAMALGLLGLNTGVIANADAFVDRPASIAGEEALARHFPAGTGSPVTVISNAGAADDVRQAFEDTDGIAEVTEPESIGDLVYMEGTLDAAPDSPAAQDTVEAVRDSVHAVPDADALVGGNTAIALDAKNAAARDSTVIMPLVLVAVFVILMILLRAFVAPLILVATVVLSFAAALGLSSLIFEHLLGFAGADTAFPLFVFVFLVALGIDYNIFLMTRVHEEAKQHGTRRGALIGLAATGGVITSAGLVLAGTFAVLATLPVVAFAEIGIAVALGVLLDTLIVRSILVTALNLDLGRVMWWPSALSKHAEPTAAEVADEPDEVTEEPRPVR
ncbi:MMPL family transporter [Jiangella alkaliphila]|uniref:Putative drug exporter of the RND superfamily n=1 Tax=Jiangella alkaliphila TaxID=419479 RepID=A0A1H2K047_9ACTN|nr:MMPL family transporter [Jiangella alkaliphila]SDU62064.1 putative drug exporter of the RND superfamily [Jiangella alkaliphila]